MPGRCGVFTWWGQTKVTGGKYAFLMSSGDQASGDISGLLSHCLCVSMSWQMSQVEFHSSCNQSASPLPSWDPTFCGISWRERLCWELAFTQLQGRTCAWAASKPGSPSTFLGSPLHFLLLLSFPFSSLLCFFSLPALILLNIPFTQRVTN